MNDLVCPDFIADDDSVLNGAMPRVVTPHGFQIQFHPFCAQVPVFFFFQKWNAAFVTAFASHSHIYTLWWL